MPLETVRTDEERKYFETKGEVMPAAEPEKPAPPADPGPVETKVTETDAVPVEAGPDDDPEKPENKGKFVRLGALHEEREKRRELERRLAEKEARDQQFEGRLEELRQIALRGYPQPEPTPQPEPEPLDQLAELRQWKQQSEQERQAAAQENAFRQAYAASAQQFKAQAPDFDDAYKFLIESRAAGYKATGLYNDEQIAGILAYEEGSIARQAMQRGINPAQAVYKLAESWGYKKAAPLSPPAPPAPTPAEKLSTIANGQQAGKSLSAAAGGSETPLSLESLAAMSREDFKKIALDPKKWKALMG